MKRSVLIVFFFLFIFAHCVGQIRLGTLTVERHEVYELQGSDILVVDTLVLRDSARVILNATKKDNFIHAKKIVAGHGSVIEGRGKNGIPGNMGNAGISFSGPCRGGSDGQDGTPGTAGKDGANLFMYVDEFRILGDLRIDLSGGDGGDGGKGGIGGDGNPGTKLCQGGNGGDGGSGATGGNGGHGGNLRIVSKYGTSLNSWIGDRIFFRSYGGFAGIGGDGGLGGQRGLSSSRDGEQGKRGVKGSGGTPGKPGGIFLEKK